MSDAKSIPDVLPYQPKYHDELWESAKEDSHIVIAPTQVVVKGGHIVGYASIGAIPMVHVWLDSRHVFARESVGLLEVTERIIRPRAGAYIMPCSEQSPFYKYMPKLGFTVLGNASLNFKRF